MKMVTSRHFGRVDILDLKDLIYKKIGPQRAEKYFDHLKRFFWLKLSKNDFDKYCIKTIGRENIPLHNLLIRSIVRNICQATVPPQKTRSDKIANGYQKNSLQTLYGDSLPQSPRKCRSPINRDRKLRDRPYTLVGPTLSKSPCEETVTRIQEQQSVMELYSLCSRPLPGVEDGEEVEQVTGSPNVPKWSLVTAPLGVSVRTDSVRKYLQSDQSFDETCRNKGVLPDTLSLKGRMEKRLTSEGVGVSLDSAVLLNNSLDLFLKRLIEPCIGISGSWSMDPCGRSNNQMISNRRFAQVARRSNYTSMLDFRVSMESSPYRLGDDWPVQLEKVSHYSIQR